MLAVGEQRIQTSELHGAQGTPRATSFRAPRPCDLRSRDLRQGVNEPPGQRPGKQEEWQYVSSKTRFAWQTGGAVQEAGDPAIRSQNATHKPQTVAGIARSGGLWWLRPCLGIPASQPVRNQLHNRQTAGAAGRAAPANRGKKGASDGNGVRNS